MKPGDVLGNYEILELVGAGAMGDVFRARQISMNRIVALKILPERFAENENFVERFVREARSAGRCSHANLIPGMENSGTRRTVSSDDSIET